MDNFQYRKLKYNFCLKIKLKPRLKLLHSQFYATINQIKKKH